MKTLNEKAFAISTLLYGLLIISVLVIFMIVSMAAFTKKSSSDFVNDLEKELITWADANNNRTCSR